VPGFQQRLDDTRNMYSSGPSMAPSSSAAMLNQTYSLPGKKGHLTLRSTDTYINGSQKTKKKNLMRID
jgi:hypothetical protein